MFNKPHLTHQYSGINCTSPHTTNVSVLLLIEAFIGVVYKRYKIIIILFIFRFLILLKLQVNGMSCRLLWNIPRCTCIKDFITTDQMNISNQTGVNKLCLFILWSMILFIASFSNNCFFNWRPIPKCLQCTQKCV